MPLPHEIHSRRPGFLGGSPVRLADGRDWVLPGPAEIDSAGPELRAEVVALLTAIAASEDEAERRRGELALAILLVAVNYVITPDGYSRLLSYPPGDLAFAGLQAALHDHARRLLDALRPGPRRPVRPWWHRLHLPTCSRCQARDTTRAR